MKVRLIPITTHGASNLVQHGTIWLLVKEQRSVECLEGKPGYLLQSLKTGNTRWLQKTDSRHYQIEMIGD